MIVLNINVPGVIFDFAAFNFHVPICGSTAKHAAAAKAQQARVNPIVFFISLDRIGILILVNTFSAQTRALESCRKISADVPQKIVEKRTPDDIRT